MRSADGIPSTSTARLLTLNGGTTAAAGEIITITCTALPATAISFVNPSPITIDALGVRGNREAYFDVVGVWDYDNLVSRSVRAECTITSTAAGRTPAKLTIPVVVQGIAQPSFALLCPVSLGDDLLGDAPTTCGTTATVFANSTLLVIGAAAGSGAPQPPFDTTPGATTAFVAGVRCATSVVPGSSGTRLLVTTPRAEEIQAARGAPTDAFAAGYYDFRIETSAGAQGVYSGAVSVGPNATRAYAGVPGCAARGLCPDVGSQQAGVYYTVRCDDYDDPNEASSNAGGPTWSNPQPCASRAVACCLTLACVLSRSFAISPASPPTPIFGRTSVAVCVRHTALLPALPSRVHVPRRQTVPDGSGLLHRSRGARQRRTSGLRRAYARTVHWF